MNSHIKNFVRASCDVEVGGNVATVEFNMALKLSILSALDLPVVSWAMLKRTNNESGGVSMRHEKRYYF